MGEKTGISWCDHTFNPVWGCTRVSAGCVHCYAETWAKRSGVGWGPRAERRTFGDKHWNEPLRWNRLAQEAGVRRRVFCGSMCDIFEDHPITRAQWPRLYHLILRTPWLDWLLLTKRPEKIYSRLDAVNCDPDELVEHVYLGTSAEDQETANLRIPYLRRFNAKARFVSYEPALGQVDWKAHLSRQQGMFGIDWIIVGGESGHGARPFDIGWARSTVSECKAAGVACFVKQLGAQPRCNGGLGWEVNGVVHPVYWPKLRDKKGGVMAEWPPDLRVQEFPASEAP